MVLVNSKTAPVVTLTVSVLVSFGWFGWFAVPAVKLPAVVSVLAAVILKVGLPVVPAATLTSTTTQALSPALSEPVWVMDVSVSGTPSQSPSA